MNTLAVTNQTAQCNELLFQGVAIGFVSCLVVMLIVAYIFYQKLLTEKKSLKDELIKAKKTILSAQESHQILVDQQQESQDLLEERVQERTLELQKRIMS